MKKFILIFLLLNGHGFLFAQKHEFGFGYQLTLPMEMMQNGFNTGHGINLHYFKFIRSVKGLSLGAQLSYGLYASKEKPQHYVFSDGSSTHTTASLSSSMAFLGISARYAPFIRNKISPFVELNGGFMGMYSSLYIADPTDPLGCRALENATLVDSEKPYIGLGTGLQVYLGKGRKEKDQHLLELSARVIRGGNIEYANMNRTYDNQNNNPGAPLPSPEAGQTPLMITFINVSSSQQHMHSVAELYDHPLRMAQFQLQYIFRIK